MNDMMEHISNVNTFISGLCNQLKIASAEQHEYSEAFTIGGPQGMYRLRSPYTGQSQFRVESISGTAGANGYIILVAPDQNISIPGFVVGDTPTTEFSGIRGLLYLGSTITTVPTDSSWYDLTNSENTLYINIQTTISAYAVIQFRHKR